MMAVASLTAHAFCKDPVAAVCGGRRTYRDDRERAWEQEMSSVVHAATRAAYPGRKEEDVRFTLDSAAERKAYLDYVGAVFEGATQAAKPPKAFLPAVLSELKSAVASHPGIDRKEKLRSKADGVHILASRRDVEDEIAFFEKEADPASVEGGNPSAMILEEIQDSCERNLGNAGAYHVAYPFVGRNDRKKKIREYVLLCPAELLWSREPSGKKRFRDGFLAQALAHELAHAIDPDFDEALYDPFVKCLVGNEGQYGKLDDRPAKRAEIAADYWSAEVLALHARAVSGEPEQGRLLGDALDQYCGASENETYPSGEYRIKVMGLDPRLRAALACGEKKTSIRAGCALEGKVAL